MAGTQLAGTGQSLDTSLNTINSEFNLLRDEMEVMRKVCRSLPLKPHEGRSKNILNYGRATAFDLTDGVDLTQGSDLADTQTAYSPAEVGVQVVMAKTTMRRVADPDLYRRVGQMIANAYNLKEDKDGCTQLDSFSTSLGAAGNVMSPGHHFAAVTRLGIGNSTATPEPAPDPIHAVYHPSHLHVLIGRLIPLATTPAGGTAFGVDGGVHVGTSATVGRGAMGEDLTKRGKQALAELFGVKIWSDANITVDSSNDAKGGVFSKEGLIFVPEMEPGREDEKDASARSIELNYIGSYVWGLYRSAAYGVEMLFDASMPTS